MWSPVELQQATVKRESAPKPTLKNKGLEVAKARKREGHGFLWLKCRTDLEQLWQSNAELEKKRRTEPSKNLITK